MTTPLYSARLMIRPFTPADRAEYLRIHAEGRDHFAPWMPLSPLSDDAHFDKVLAGEADPTICRRAAFLPDGRLAGIFSFTQVFHGPFQNAYAGWRIARDQIGNGLATEGMTAMLDLAFRAASDGGLGLHRVQANIIPSNSASLRVAEKLGMRREGLALRYLQIAGRWQDHAMYAKTSEEHEIAP